ncbi:MAG: hypothetical protein H7Y12_03655, partial [Sphingobacteriaceae bacterium]|nr:hypothetical protein [Cytophagaceae bacterium]
MVFFKKTLLVAALSASAATSFAQSASTFQNLFVAREIQAAYDKGTRSTDGKPGPNYWQNYSDYKIRVALDPATRLISGSETVTYHNESPNTIQNLVIRLYPEIFDKSNARDPRNVEAVDLKDSAVVKLPVVRINGQDVKPNRQGTNAILRIPGGLETKKTLTLDVTWSYPIPEKSHIREGTYFKTSFMVAYWYPQIAVYDDLNGWASHPYTGQQEFYNEFADYDVTINMPQGFQVWATGEWQNAKDVLNPAYYSRWEKAHSSAEVISVFSEKELKAKQVFKNSGASHMAFRFKASDVPDFAFATSDHYNWDATSVVVVAAAVV